MEHAKHDLEMRSYYAARASRMQYDRLDEASERTLDRYAGYLQDRLRGCRVLEIACGTGYWSERIAETAESVFATDAVPEMIALAKRRTYPRRNVELACREAYALRDVPTGFDAGFHFQWFSHVPRSKIGTFLSSFHSKLEPGARVVFGDNLDQGEDPDAEGNLYQRRRLPGTRVHRIIKNCPSQTELDEILAPFTRAALHQRFERDWFVSYELIRPGVSSRESGDSARALSERR